jgi:hypothetical protein
VQAIGVVGLGAAVRLTSGKHARQLAGVERVGSGPGRLPCTRLAPGARLDRVLSGEVVGLPLAGVVGDLAGEPVDLGIQGGQGGVGPPQLMLAAGQGVGEGSASVVGPAWQLLELFTGLLHGRVQGVAVGAELLALGPALVELLNSPGVLRRQRPRVPALALRLGRVACGGSLGRALLLPGGVCGQGPGLGAGVFERGVAASCAPLRRSASSSTCTACSCGLRTAVSGRVAGRCGRGGRRRW